MYATVVAPPPPPPYGDVRYSCHHRTWAEERSTCCKVGSCRPPSQLVLCLLVQINLDTGCRSPGTLLMEHELEGARMRHRHRNKLPETRQMSQELLPGYGQLGTRVRNVATKRDTFTTLLSLGNTTIRMRSRVDPRRKPKRASDCAADR